MQAQSARHFHFAAPHSGITTEGSNPILSAFARRSSAGAELHRASADAIRHNKQQTKPTILLPD
jgi:hypothetical protein